MSQAPHRHIGLAYLPMWDVDAAVAEVEWAHDAGLRGVNFPAMRDGELPEYNRRVWEPLWSVCEERRMPLVTHVGAGTNARYSRPRRRRAPADRVRQVHVHAGGLVADLRRRLRAPPGLKLVITETPGNWFPPTAAELDGVWAVLRREARRAAEQGAARAGATAAERVHGEERVLRRQLRVAVRGRPSRRSTGSTPSCCGDRTTRTSKARSCTRTARHAVGDPAVAAQHVLRRPAGRDTCGWSAATRSTSTTSTRYALQQIATQIDAPTLDDLATPIDAVPAGASITAFRSGAGGWG